MAGALESFFTLLDDAAQMGTDGRHRTYSLVIPVNKQLPVGKVGERIDREIVLAPYLEPLPVPAQAGNELTQKAEGREYTRGGSNPDGGTFDEIPAGMRMLVIFHPCVGMVG